MAKGRRDPDWQQKVLEWQASGKASSTWCKENQIPYTTFFGWKRRFESSRKRANITPPHKGFVELKDQPAPNAVCSGVTLEYQGIKICLHPGFNPIVLKQCIACLGGASC
jgi:hypothetical protein